MNCDFGIRRVVIERARRRGYAIATGEALRVLMPHVPKGARAALVKWSKAACQWHRAAVVGAELSLPPKLEMPSRTSR